MTIAETLSSLCYKGAAAHVKREGFSLWREAKYVGGGSSLKRWFKAGVLMLLLELADCNKIGQEIVNPFFSERKTNDFL